MRLLCFLVCCLCFSLRAAALTPEEAGARLRMALQIARERNDSALVQTVEELGRAFRQQWPEDADQRLRQAEASVGIDPGGWSMAGQPLFHPTPEMKAREPELRERLTTAMKSGDAAAVRAVTADMLTVLGDQAGVPDGRRAGHRPAPLTLDEAAATRLFLDALKSQGKAVRDLSAGKPLPNQMARLYAGILDSVVTIRPFVEKHQPQSLAELDKLATGTAAVLLALQQPEGHFPFPDLRGKNIRFGDMIEKQAQRGAVEIQEGWVITSDPDGGTQFDTGVCGTALLLAGRLYQNAAWKNAGLRAAEWALAQSCCANFNYTAFSVSLLAHAFQITGERKYLDGALTKFRVGIAPGQAPNGRWLDAHNARTVYHVIILRALGDLASALPADQRSEVEAVIEPALAALLDEWDAMGITVEALPELLILSSLRPEDGRLKKAIQTMAASLVSKSTDGQRVKMGAQPHQLAAIPRAL